MVQRKDFLAVNYTADPMTGCLCAVVDKHPETLAGVQNPALGDSAVSIEQYVAYPVPEGLLDYQCYVGSQHNGF